MSDSLDDLAALIKHMESGVDLQDPNLDKRTKEKIRYSKESDEWDSEALRIQFNI